MFSFNVFLDMLIFKMVYTLILSWCSTCILGVVLHLILLVW